MLKFKKIFLAVAALFVSVVVFAQGTTSSMTGAITDQSGEPLIGATVVAVHTPSGSQYYAIAGNNGYYTINGMRPGGPYVVTVQLMGMKTVKYEGLTLQLGETSTLDATLAEDTEMLNEVVVIADAASRFTTEKTGASTNVSNKDMMSLPNTSRSITAITKLSPYSNGMSFAGGDGRSTNFTVDGANFNNNFGLSSSLPGGGTPISLDALEEMQIVIAPYDVRQSNFVGGGINAITKSGTNTVKASVYGYYADENFRGNKINGEDLGDRKPEQNKIIGLTVGGPIIKDKLFFFVNVESQKKPEQTIKYQPDASKQKVLEQISQKLQNEYNYNPGSYTNFPGGTDNFKILARLDWNISDAHKLSFRFNKTNNEYWYAPNGNSCDDSFRNKSYNRSSEQSHPFANNMYSQMNNVTSFAAELNSRFGAKAANRFLATYTDINDQRGSNSDLFPHVDIMTGDYSSGNFIPYTSLGYELFTYNNGVLNKNLQFQDDVTLYLGSHTVTAGARFEWMKAHNSYMRNGTGYYRYASVDDFLNGGLPLSFCLTYGYDGNENPAGVVQYTQSAAYAQDEWKVTRNFKLTYGLRAEVVAFNDDAIVTNPNIAAINYDGKHIDTGVWPTTRVQLSPRVGFNWDVNSDKSLVVRGGLGIFQGRLPLVFFTNMPQNSGMIQGTYSASASINKQGELVYSDAAKAALQKLTAGGKMMTDTKQIISTLGLSTKVDPNKAGLGGQNYIGGVDQNFRMPQIFKTSVAVDYKVPVNFPLSITGEAMFNKTIYGVMIQDWSLNDNGSALKHFNGPDNRIMNINDSRYDKTNAYVMTNTSKGYGYSANITINAEPVKNLKVMAAYTHTESKELSGMPGSAANSVFTGLPTVNGANLTGLQRSQYVVPNKIMASVNYAIPAWALNFNLYYTASSAAGNSYIYSNDMNGDKNATDLIYIPATKDEILFKTDADRDAFWKFLENDKYLSSHKGQYAEAYAGRAPWLHRFDFSVTKDFRLNIGNTKHTFQLSASIDNIGNLINSKWGITKMSAYQTSLNGTIAPLKYEGVDANNTPIFSMVQVDKAYPVQNYIKSYINNTQCWHALIGLKYYFN